MSQDPQHSGPTDPQDGQNPTREPSAEQPAAERPPVEEQPTTLNPATAPDQPYRQQPPGAPSYAPYPPPSGPAYGQYPPSGAFGQSQPGQPQPGQPQATHAYGRTDQYQPGPPQGARAYGPPQPAQPQPDQPQGGYGYPQAGPAPHPDEDRNDNPFAALLDLSFTHFATPALIKFLYVLLLVLGVLWWLVGIVAGFSASGLAGLGALIGGAIGLLVWLLLVRVSLEYALSMIRVAQETRIIRKHLDDLRAERDGEADRGGTD